MRIFRFPSLGCWTLPGSREKCRHLPLIAALAVLSSCVAAPPDAPPTVPTPGSTEPTPGNQAAPIAGANASLNVNSTSNDAEDGTRLFRRYQEPVLRILPLEPCIRQTATRQGDAPPADLLTRYLQLQPSVIDDELSLCRQDSTRYVDFRQQDSRALSDLAQCVAEGVSSNSPLGCSSLPDTLVAGCTRVFMSTWRDAQSLRPACSEPT